ncbi:hypothetical protein MPSI1_002812 [Malassezia psittaci]|uniref:Uncharacterized protein n=1 Tax=Malassezia psittaci TaxID=1821823 RepID=A0AAF0JLG8_9BASI|nr:hypothetical protein MPSI1_002812 [Malassezia psittaci]
MLVADRIGHVCWPGMRQERCISSTRLIVSPASLTPKASAYPIAYPPDVRAQREEKSRLLEDIEAKLKSSSNPIPQDVLSWYLERVKESRTRLTSGSASSSEALLALMKLARKRRDVSTLQKLRANLLSSEQDSLTSLLARDSVQHTAKSLLSQLDNMLFSLAAQQERWSSMLAIVTSSHTQRWSPYMCRALLRTDGALEMIAAQTRRMNPKTNLSEREADSRHTLWTMFKKQFGLIFQESLNKRCNSQNSAAVPKPIPSWIFAAILNLYARSGQASQAVSLTQLYLAALTKKKSPDSSNPNSIVLSRRPCFLVGDTQDTIPGHVLLNLLLSAFIKGKDISGAIQLFHHLTKVPLPADIIDAKQVFLFPATTLEPDMKSVLLTMDAILAADVKHTGTTLLSFLQAVENNYGLLASSDPRTHPLIFDCRPFIKIWEYAIQANDQVLARRTLRYYQGCLRREQRWYIDHHKLASKNWKQTPNQFRLLNYLDKTMHKLRSQRWIHISHAKALRGLALKAMLLQRPTSEIPAKTGIS